MFIILTNNFVENSYTLHSFIYFLRVEISKIWNAGMKNKFEIYVNSNTICFSTLQTLLQHHL